MELKTKKLLIGGGILLFGVTGFIVTLKTSGQNNLKINSKQIQNDTIPKKLSLFFVGDMMGHKPMIDAAFVGDEYVYNPWFQYIKSHIQKYDFAIANLEVTLAGYPYSGYPMFCSPDSYAKSMQENGFDFLITANNHSQDKGRKGLERTIDVLDSLKFRHTGTFKNQVERDKNYPYYWENKGVKIAFLNYSYGTNGIPVTPPNIVNLIDTNQIKIDIRRAQKDGSQFIITTLHWGDEYKRRQNPWQDNLAQWLADNGVDAIIGMHPHVVQPMKIIHPKNNIKKSVPVAFSLGNFISNQRDRYKNGGIGVELNLQVLNGKVTWDNWGYYPFWVQLGGKPRGYYIIPVSDWEKNTEKYKLTSEESGLIKEFAADTRELLKGVKEFFFE